MTKKLLNYILKSYLKSSDYKGCLIKDLCIHFPNIKLLKKSVITLLKNKKIDLYYCKTNPFVKNFDLKISRKKMIELIETLPQSHSAFTTSDTLAEEQAKWDKYNFRDIYVYGYTKGNADFITDPDSNPIEYPSYFILSSEPSLYSIDKYLLKILI